jgi:tripartite-type tricarboxylate transporter receptor subunit TctC
MQKRIRGSWRALILVALTGTAAAQQYPTRSIRMIIPAGPGGGVDTIARVIGTPLSTALGQPVVMDNKPGAGTMLASELVAKSPPDGYTILMATNSHAINAGIHKNLRYEAVNDFAMVTLAASVPQVLVVHPVVRAKSVKELIALARRNPGKLHFASAGTGSGTHLAAELFASMAHLSMLHVPYRSGSAALIDLAGGHVDLMFSNTINSGPYVRSGKLNALAITTVRRSPQFPELPTIAESGVPGYRAEVWYGVLVPARTPSDIMVRLNREIVAILRTNETRQKFAAQGADTIGSTPEEFATVMKNDIAKWAKVAASMPMQMD